MQLEHSGQHEITRTRWISVLTDVHFWVPVAVLLGGLILLHWIS